ncbi:hypothetical protein ACWA5Z_04145 [Testudinibacter sp. P80/BLE/0925]|uniref:hypothetical protein n=1 Tax=Testudinibacter sp. TW-1 TaxID=3417757 RepID=UPI003D364D8D
MIFGYDEFPDKKFLVHIDILEKDNSFLYGAFNFIFQEKIYPAFGTGWTINLITEYMAGLLQFSEGEFYYENSDILDGRELFKEAVISRLGYFYDTPHQIIPDDDFKKKYPQKIGVELEVAELGDSGLEIYVFKGKCGEYLVFHYNDIVTKVNIDINNLKILVNKIYKFINEINVQ